MIQVDCIGQKRSSLCAESTKSSGEQAPVLRGPCQSESRVDGAAQVDDLAVFYVSPPPAPFPRIFPGL